MPRPAATVRTILDVPVQVRTFDEAVERIDARYARREQVAIAFANAHSLNVASESAEFRRALQNSLVFNDGIGVDIASRLLYGSPFPENLNGTDFGPNYLRATRHRYRIFLLGAKPGTAERAAQRLSSLCPQHAFVGCHHGHFEDERAPRDHRSRSPVQGRRPAGGHGQSQTGALHPEAPGCDGLHSSA